MPLDIYWTYMRLDCLIQKRIVFILGDPVDLHIQNGGRVHPWSARIFVVGEIGWRLWRDTATTFGALSAND